MTVRAGKAGKIGWVLLSPVEAPQPSTRIAALNMMGKLAQRGFESSILYQPELGCEQPELPAAAELIARARREQCRLVIFQKVHGPSVEALVDALRAQDITTVYMVCDLVLPEMVERCDLTLVVSAYLRSLHPARLQHKIKVVHDGIEHGELHKTDYGDERGSRGKPLSAVLVTSAQPRNLGMMGLPPDWLHVRVLGRHPASQSRMGFLKTRIRTLIEQESWRDRWNYLAFADHRRIDVENWSEARAYEALLAADIGIISVDTQLAPQAGSLPPMWMRKSENRLTLKMSLGLPVVASPVPAYLDVIEHGVSGFIAATPADWRRHLAELRDPGLRRAMGEAARSAVKERFSSDTQADLLAAALAPLLSASTLDSTELVEHAHTAATATAHAANQSPTQST